MTAEIAHETGLRSMVKINGEASAPNPSITTSHPISNVLKQGFFLSFPRRSRTISSKRVRLP